MIIPVLDRYLDAGVRCTQSAWFLIYSRSHDFPQAHPSLYMLAFLQNDTAAMEQQVVFGAGKPGLEGWFLGNEADTAAYSGRLEKARMFYRQAIASAVQAGEKEGAAGYQAALTEALFGNHERPGG